MAQALSGESQMAEVLATEKNEIYNKLPGIEVPVGDALLSLSEMWNAPAASESSRPPSEFRASRMNMILHFGFDAPCDEAYALFRSVIAFSRRYPCRVIALCPSKDENATGQGIVCKIFSECYIGNGTGDMSCCEAIIFGYTLKEKRYLEDQVSIFLESDLPTYYWPYRFDSPDNLSAYRTFFKNVNRIVIDTGVEHYTADRLDLPQPEKLHDLVTARTLSIRQCIGQFFSAIPMEEIVDDLFQVSITAPAEFVAEARSLLAWIEGALRDCNDRSDGPGLNAAFVCKKMEEGEASSLRILFSYGSSSFVECFLDLEAGVAQIGAQIGDETHSMTAAIRLLEPEEALAEALFFG